jgi:hypothetical protein
MFGVISNDLDPHICAPMAVAFLSLSMLFLVVLAVVLE